MIVSIQKSISYSFKSCCFGSLQSLVDANKNGIRLSDEDILEAVVAAAKSDNSAAIPEILQLLPREFGFGLKCVNVSFRLASLGKFNDALEVASVVPSDTKTAEDREEVGMFFLNFIMERMVILSVETLIDRSRPVDT